MTTSDEEWAKIKQWWAEPSDTDLDLMIAMGAVDKNWVIKQYRWEMVRDETEQGIAAGDRPVDGGSDSE